MISLALHDLLMQSRYNMSMMSLLSSYVARATVRSEQILRILSWKERLDCWKESRPEKAKNSSLSVALKVIIRLSLVYCLFPVPMFSKNRGGREVTIDY